MLIDRNKPDFAVETGRCCLRIHSILHSYFLLDSVADGSDAFVDAAADAVDAVVAAVAGKRTKMNHRVVVVGDTRSVDYIGRSPSWAWRRFRLIE